MLRKFYKSIFLVLTICMLWGYNGVVFASNLAEVTESTLQSNDRFTMTNAMQGMQEIHGWLKSFQTLTGLTADRISMEEKQQIGNLGADTQSLAFYNWMKSVEGTLLRQNYDICKVKYELALEKKAAGKIEQAEVDVKEKEYQKATQDMKHFLSTFHIAD